MNKANTIAEVYAIAKKLKAAGYDHVEVNNAIKERRNALLSNRSSQVELYDKRLPNPHPLQSQKISTLKLKVENLNSNRIKIDADTKTFII